MLADATAGVTISDLLQAQAHLDALTAPDTGRSCLIPPFAMAVLAKSNLNLFTPTINENVYVKGYIKEFAGADMYSYNLLPTLSIPALVGVGSGTDVVYALQSDVTDGASVVKITVPSSDNLKTLPAGTILEFTAGDVVNPETRVSIGKKYSFALAQEVLLTTGTVELPIDPAAKIYGPADSGNRQNITALPTTSSASVVVVGATKNAASVYEQIAMFAEEAYTATVIHLTTELPGAYAARADYDGISVRTSVQTVIGSDTVVHRFDILAKGILQRDQYAVRILVKRS